MAASRSPSGRPSVATAGPGSARRARSAPVRAVTPSGCSPSSSPARSRTSRPRPVDKVHTWPHLLAVEFVASLICTAFVFVFSIFVNAPLLQLANLNQTPNPSKAPWYFLGLQELLTMFHPMVAGVTIPGMGIFLLILAPYMDKNPSNKPEDRKFAISSSPSS